MTYRDSAFLRNHITSIISFYHPNCIDREFGGYINQLRDDGTIFDRMTKHLVGTCRFIYNYSLAFLVLDEPKYREAAEHGLSFLMEKHRQVDGGFAWILQGREVDDGTRHCYGHAFVLLAAAGAVKAGVDGARAFASEIYDLLESRFWEPEAQLYVDEIKAGDWGAIDPYRGQNANMHTCEAMLSAFEATGEEKYIDRAHTLAKRVCVDLAAAADGLIWEHYMVDWTHDWDYNREDPKNLFRPYGYLPGHFTEWAKLLLILERYRPEPWMSERARRLFDIALEKSWDHEYRPPYNHYRSFSHRGSHFHRSRPLAVEHDHAPPIQSSSYYFLAVLSPSPHGRHARYDLEQGRHHPAIGSTLFRASCCYKR